MTRVVVAAGINNELGSRDVAAVKRLKQAGYDVQFYYYLPKVPAEFSMLPSFNQELKEWKTHAAKMLNELGNKLEIPTGNRHFVDEILGPDRVFDEAKEIHADIILTKDKSELKQSYFSRFFDWAGGFFTKQPVDKEVPVTNIISYVAKKLGVENVRSIPIRKAGAINDERISSAQWNRKKAK